MANISPDDSLTQARLVLQENAGVPAGANAKLPGWLVTELTDGIPALENDLRAVDTEEGDRLEASEDYQQSMKDGDALVRNVNNFIGGQPLEVNQPAVRAHYGLSGGVDGRLTYAVIEQHLRDFLVASPTATPDSAKLRAETLAEITATLATIDATKAAAKLGTRVALNEAAQAKWSALETSLSRGYHFLCAALPTGVFDPRLTNYGYHARQPAGGGPPDGVDALNVNVEAGNLLRFFWSEADRATSYVLFRQRIGVDTAFVRYREDLSAPPFDLPGEPTAVELRYYVVGHNSAGDGSASPVRVVTLS